MICCRQAQCSCEKCSYFNNSVFISGVVIGFDCCIRHSALLGQGVRKIFLQASLAKALCHYSSSCLIISSSQLLDHGYHGRGTWLSQARRRTPWRRNLESGAVSQEKLSGDRMAEVPCARHEQTRRRERIGPGPKLRKWKTVLKQEWKVNKENEKARGPQAYIYKKRDFLHKFY